MSRTIFEKIQKLKTSRIFTVFLEISIRNQSVGLARPQATRDEKTVTFFKKVQNKLLWAISAQTAAELVYRRSDASLPRMGMQSLDKTNGVKTVIDHKARFTDWSRRDDIKAELKADLIILLAENGYPPVDRDEVYKEIFEQAENFKKYQKGFLN